MSSADFIYVMMVALAALVWIAWVAAPHSRVSIRLAREPVVWLGFGIIYVGLLAATMAEGLAPGAGFTSLDGVMAVFDTEFATLAGWAHYLAFDLFVGAWIIRDAPRGGYRLVPPLVLTMLVGPIGLFVYLVGRGWFRREIAQPVL